VRIRRGLDLPIDGSPQALVQDAQPVGSVALMPPDHPQLNVHMLAKEGDRVACGQALFVDRREPDVRFVSPRAGTVSRIHRGERRAVQSVVVTVDPDSAPEPQLEAVEPGAWGDTEAVRRRLLACGLWPALRSRPFGRIARPGERAHAVFVTAMDTSPLAGPLDAVLPSLTNDFVRGAQVLTTQTAGIVHVCTHAQTVLPSFEHERIRVTRFSGPHPAGLVGTHMQRLDAPRKDRVIWYVGWQDVVAIGRLAATGTLWTDRYVALGGPAVKQPRWLRTTLGACVADVVDGEVEETPCRLVSGSVLSGRQASGWGGYLGRYHNQISVLPEPGDAEPGDDGPAPRLHAFSLHRLLRRRAPRTPWTTALNGQPAPLIPLDTFERVVPLNILPTPLLRALLVNDLDAAERLGCLELEEEDLALCSFLCPSKIDYGTLLRGTLNQLAAEAPEQGP